MPTITDSEFGEITVTRRALASRVSLRIAPNGRIRITMPLHAPLASAKLLVKQSRRSIHQLITEQQGDFPYGTPQQIGKSHNLLVEQGAPAIKTVRTTIIVSVTDEQDFTDPMFQQSIRQSPTQRSQKLSATPPQILSRATRLSLRQNSTHTLVQSLGQLFLKRYYQSKYRPHESTV